MWRRSARRCLLATDLPMRSRWSTRSRRLSVRCLREPAVLPTRGGCATTRLCTRCWGIARFPGEDAIRRFFHHFTQTRIEAFWRPLWACLLGLLAEPQGGFTLDLDSTIFNREGRQEGAAKGYNPRRPGRKSHHRLLAVLAEAPFVLHAWLRSLPACSRICSGIFSVGIITAISHFSHPHQISQMRYRIMRSGSNQTFFQKPEFTSSRPVHSR
jgi:hypothetical protein